MSDSLREILQRFRVDDDLDPDQFDPASTLGNIESLKDKVDAIHWQLAHWISQAAMIQAEFIAPFIAKQKSMLKKHEKLKAYVKNQMILENFDRLPGKYKGWRIQKTADTVEFTAEANAELYLKMPELIDQKSLYSWNKAAKEVALSGSHDIPGAVVKRDNKALHPYTIGEVENDTSSKG